MIGPRGVRQRRFEQLRIAKLITEPLLAALQAEGIVRIGDRLGRLDHDQFSISLAADRRAEASMAFRPEESECVTQRTVQDAASADAGRQSPLS